MGRIFTVQAKNIDIFRKKKRRKLRKGDVIRIGDTTIPNAIRKFLDLRPKTKDVLFTKKYRNKLILDAGSFSSLEIGSSLGGFGSSGFISGAGIRKEAEDVIKSFPNPLSDKEKQAIAVFVDSNVLSGNWDLMDSFAHFGLQDPVNALWDWKRKVSMTNNGAIYNPGVGFAFDGVSAYIDSTYNPLIDGVNFQLNDALAGCFITEIGIISTGQPQILSSSNNVFNGFIGTRASDQITTYSINGSGFRDSNTPIGTLSNSLIIATDRETNTQFYQNGTLKDTSNIQGSYIVNNNIRIASDYGNNAIEITLSSFIAGATIGFNHQEYYNNLVQLNAKLEAQTIIDAFPNPLTQIEEDSIRVFLLNEIIVGNWQKIDSFAHFGLQDPINALWDWKRKAVMTNNGAVHIPGIGFDFDGVGSYINSNYNYLTDRINVSATNLLVGAFAVTADNRAGNYTLLGVREADVYTSINILRTTNIVTRILNGFAPSSLLPYQDNTLYIGERIAINDAKMYVNGIEEGFNSSLALSIFPNFSQTIGALNNENLYSLFYQGTISSFITGAAIGFNHQEYYNNLVQLNTDLS